MIWKIWKNYIKNILQQQEKDTPLQTLGIVGSVRGSDSGSVVGGGDGVTVVVAVSYTHLTLPTSAIV